jgi:hypothetical protein
VRWEVLTDIIEPKNKKGFIFIKTYIFIKMVVRLSKIKYNSSPKEDDPLSFLGYKNAHYVSK